MGLLFGWLHHIPLWRAGVQRSAFAPGGLLSPCAAWRGHHPLRFAKIVRVMNPPIAEGLKAQLGERLKVLPVKVVAIKAIPRNTPPEQPTIIIVSRLSPEKGVDIALEVMARVQRELPEANLLIAGDGAEQSPSPRRPAVYSSCYFSELFRRRNCPLLNPPRSSCSARDKRDGVALIEAM